MKNVTVILTIVLLLFFCGCDPAYYSTYRVSLDRNQGNLALCSQFEDPNDITKLIEKVERDYFNIPHETQKPIHYPYLHYEQQDEGIILLEFTGLTHRTAVNEAKKLEEKIVSKLKQEECLKIEKVD